MSSEAGGSFWDSSVSSECTYQGRPGQACAERMTYSEEVGMNRDRPYRRLPASTAKPLHPTPPKSHSTL